MKTLPLAALALALSASLLGGAVINYSIDTVLIGGVAPAPPPPYATVVIETVDPDTVKMTVASSLAGVGEFWSALGWNLKADYVFDGTVSIGAITTSGAFAIPSVIYGTDIKSGGGGINYDIWFDFATAPPGERFDGNDSFSIIINGVTTDDFLSSPISQQVIMHGQGLTAGQSDWIGTTVGGQQLPEPSSAMLGSLGAFALFRRHRNRQRN